MSGHITRMSRGSRVGSSSSRPTSTSRSTSTWRAAPWHACTCTDRSPSWSPSPPAWPHPARCWPAGRAAASRAACRPAPVGGSGAGPFAGRACRDHRQRPLQLACVPSERPEERMPDELPARSSSRGTGPDAARPARSSHRGPETCGSHRCTSRSSPERAEQRHLGDRQTGVPEERQPGRQVEAVTAAAQPLQRLGVADVGRHPTHPLHEAAPQLGLPQEVVVELVPAPSSVPALAPVGDQPGPLDGVRREEPGDATGHGVAAAAPQLALVAVDAEPEVRRERRAPGLPHRLVDDLEQRPDHPVGVPGVVAILAEQHRHQRVRAQEPDPGAHPVTAARADPEPVREPLREPALHAPRGHDDELLGERVVERRREQVAQTVGEEVGALGTMDPQGHGLQDATSCRHLEEARAGSPTRETADAAAP